MITYKNLPPGPYNSLVYFVSPNPPTSFLPISQYPKIQQTSFIGPFSTIIGDVTIQEYVFIASNVSVRADEGAPFHIGAYSNLQEGVILHGLKNEVFKVDDTEFSIYIGEHVSCAHDSMIHGPCIIGNRCFIGFKSIVFNAILEDDVYVSPGCIITNQVHIPSNRFVPPGAIIDTQEKANKLKTLPISKEQFANEVQQVNTEFSMTYSLLFGSNRCSCGLACD